MDYVCKVKIFESNGLPPLIQLLTSPDPDVKKNSLEIIFNTAQVDFFFSPVENKKKLHARIR